MRELRSCFIFPTAQSVSVAPLFLDWPTRAFVARCNGRLIGRLLGFGQCRRREVFIEAMRLAGRATTGAAVDNASDHDAIMQRHSQDIASTDLEIAAISPLGIDPNGAGFDKFLRQSTRLSMARAKNRACRAAPCGRRPRQALPIASSPCRHTGRQAWRRGCRDQTPSRAFPHAVPGTLPVRPSGFRNVDFHCGRVLLASA